MKQTTLILIGSTLFASSIFVNIAHAAVIDRATMLGNTCAGCHGVNGISDGAIPSIAGLPSRDLSESMHAFASGERASTVMQRIAKGYSDADIKALATHFSQLPASPKVEQKTEHKAEQSDHDHNHGHSH